jgi:branched-chain amino acid transport system ATP-binding protein
MTQAVLSASGVCKSFGGVAAVDDVGFDLRQGELHAIIGPNGAGKTTFLSLLTGELRADHGRITLLGEDISALSFRQRAQHGMARTFQVTSVFEDLTVQENMLLAVQSHQDHAYRFWEPAEREQAMNTTARAGLANAGLLDRSTAPAAFLSHGERRALELAMALAAKPRVLLLDEPMAGVGTLEAAGVVERWRQLKGEIAIVLIEHDMQAVFSLADRITVLAQGRVVACGAPAEISADPAVQAVYLGADSETEMAALGGTV